MSKMMRMTMRTTMMIMRMMTRMLAEDVNDDKGGDYEGGDGFVTVLTRCRPPVPFLARTTLSLLEMYMYLGGTKCETIFPCRIVFK